MTVHSGSGFLGKYSGLRLQLLTMMPRLLLGITCRLSLSMVSLSDSYPLNSIFLLFHSLGCPRIVRVDRGSENSRIAFLQPFLRRNGRDSFAGTGSFQYGRSASNQVHYN